MVIDLLLSWGKDADPSPHQRAGTVAAQTWRRSRPHLLDVGSYWTCYEGWTLLKLSFFGGFSRTSCIKFVNKILKCNESIDSISMISSFDSRISDNSSIWKTIVSTKSPVEACPHNLTVPVGFPGTTQRRQTKPRRHVDISRKLPWEFVVSPNVVNLEIFLVSNNVTELCIHPLLGVSTLPAELQRNFGLIRELDEKSSCMWKFPPYWKGLSSLERFFVCCFADSLISPSVFLTLDFAC